MGSCYGESADKDHILSSKKVEADEEGVNLNTVGWCLRGRLLAERQASKVAKMEAQSMGNKLVELEKLLREEIKLRDRAERRLELLKKKVGSFNMPSKSGQLEHSDSTEEKCESENSCGSSSITSLSKHSEATEIKHDAAKIESLTENVDHIDNVSEASTLIQTHNADNFSTNSDTGCSSPQILRENPNPNRSSGNFKNDESRVSSSRSRSSSVITENESDDHGDFYDNSLALVPVTVIATSSQEATNNNPKPINVSVLEALDALRHARERLLSSMRTRQQIIHVGPI